ncbi:hypothetical protein Nwi_0901 [Nitrobacter winogradskyi Nb-255]|uniref:Uncharacterized protein n=1 Tax=Nitrobacter winogradskyi (strain ATCC 25391 / DSM 10237 / CIP 104748 / NCIMB 11846 / Nb-255) TaxID=323098 RepID=Q3SU78_NITWN|nr:hypothetical protein Nwi_0901 [Nitrobacter winogradskyi Nb-255]
MTVRAADQDPGSGGGHTKFPSHGCDAFFAEMVHLEGATCPFRQFPQAAAEIASRCRSNTIVSGDGMSSGIASNSASVRATCGAHRSRRI